MRFGYGGSGGGGFTESIMMGLTRGLVEKENGFLVLEIRKVDLITVMDSME